MSGDLAFGKVSIWGFNAYTVVGSFLCCLTHSLHESRTAVGIYGMVASVVGYHQSFQTTTLCQATGYTEHNTIAEWNHCRTHILVVVASFWNVFGTAQ